MTRLPDWHSRYVEFIDEMRRVPFEWGTNDCGAGWAGRVIEVLTGEKNPAALYVGRYSTALGAIRMMNNDGFDDLKELATFILNREPEHPSRGYIGDIALIEDDSPFGYALGIVNGERVFFRREDGIGTVDLLECDSIFKV